MAVKADGASSRREAGGGGPGGGGPGERRTVEIRLLSSERGGVRRRGGFGGVTSLRGKGHLLGQMFVLNTAGYVMFKWRRRGKWQGSNSEHYRGRHSKLC
jgi:hypothetical protein